MVASRWSHPSRCHCFQNECEHRAHFGSSIPSDEAEFEWQTTVICETAVSLGERSDTPLEVHLQCKLHLSWSVRGRANESKRVARQSRIWGAPNDPVEHIEHFPPEIHPDGFSKLECTGNRNIFAHNPRPSCFRVQGRSTAETIAENNSL